MTDWFAHLNPSKRKENRGQILGLDGETCVHIQTLNPDHPEAMIVFCTMTNGRITAPTCGWTKEQVQESLKNQPLIASYD